MANDIVSDNPDITIINELGRPHLWDVVYNYLCCELGREPTTTETEQRVLDLQVKVLGD